MFRALLRKKWIALFLSVSMTLTLLGLFTVKTENSASAATTSFRFIVMGDSRGSSSGINETAMRNLLSKVKNLSTQPAFILFTGDQVYGGSNVENELIQWKNVVDDYYPINMYYPSLGNHENNETIFSRVFDYLPNEQLSGYQRSAYYFDYGNARFITVNSNRKDANGKYIITSAQRTWVENLIKNSGKTHHFVQFHVPAYPIGAHYGNSLDGNPAERDAFWDMLDNNNVTAVFVGHEHNYNRRQINSTFNGNGKTFERSIYQLTLGGAGAPLTTSNKDSRNVNVGPIGKFHYMVVDVADGNVTYKVYDDSNNQIDSFTTSAGTAPAPQTTVHFQDGVYPSSSYAGTKDTYISQNNATTAYGSATTLMVDGDDPNGSTYDKNILIRWDTSSIATTKKVVSASITVNVVDASNHTYNIYEMKRAFSQSGSTWNVFASGSNWEVAGGNGSSDRGSTVLGTMTGTTGTKTFSLNASGIALVQKWINTPSSNNGLIILNSSSTDGFDFSSREAATASQRPRLTITYE